MPDRFDQTGTAPGLANMGAAKNSSTVAMKCRNPMGCESVQAIEVSASQANNPTAGKPHVRIYQCIKCQHTMHVNTGGHAGF